MSDRANIAYAYDGSFEGLLCCVCESFEKKELPAAVTDENREAQQFLYSVVFIETDAEKAKRVSAWLKEKISGEALGFFRDAYLTCAEQREIKLIKVAWLMRRHGKKALELFSQECVFTLTKAVRHMHNEAHLLLGFLRFSEHEGFLTSVITPKNNLLPLIVPHFCSRMNAENFMIFDKTHSTAALYRSGGTLRFIGTEGLELPEAGEDEEKYRKLWRRFYESIAVEGRINEKLRQTHMPKRYWENMTEMRTHL